MNSLLRINFFNKNKESIKYICILLILLVLPLIWGGCVKEEAITNPEEIPQPDPLDENDLPGSHGNSIGPNMAAAKKLASNNIALANPSLTAREIE